MKKRLLPIGLGLIALLFFAVPNIHGAECKDVPTNLNPDQLIEVTYDGGANIRDRITGAEEENCPESTVIGGASQGNRYWANGIIETGFLLSDEGEEPEVYGAWYRIDYNGQAAYIWSDLVEVVEPTDEELADHEEVTFDEVSEGEQDGGEAVDNQEEDNAEEDNQGEDEAEDDIAVIDPEDDIIAAEFLDIDNHPYEKQIDFLRKEGVVKGRETGYFVPDKFLNRADFTTMAIRAKTGTDPVSFANENYFSDIDSTKWYAGPVNYAKSNNIVQGVGDNLFEPLRNIEYSEAFVVIVKAFNLKYEPETEKWWEVYEQAMKDGGYVPSSFNGDPKQLVTRADMAFMIAEVMIAIDNGTAVLAGDADKQPAVCFDDNLPDGTEWDEIYDAVIKQHNDYRLEKQLPPLEIHPALNQTASAWSAETEAKGELTHERPGITTEAWLDAFGMSFDSINGHTFSETLGLSTYLEPTGDQSFEDSVIAATQVIFDSFVNQNDDENGHLGNVANPNFKHLGVGIQLSDDNRMYYTLHYGNVRTGYDTNCE